MKNAIIVGASSGMGYELAKRLAGDGYRVGVTARRLPLLRELQESMPLQLFPIEMDACDVNSVDRHKGSCSAIRGIGSPYHFSWNR